MHYPRITSFVLIPPQIQKRHLLLITICPQAENIIYQTVRNDHPKPSSMTVLLGIAMHHCCSGKQSRKRWTSVRSFYVIEDAKEKIEKACPRTVSCADVLAIAAS